MVMLIYPYKPGSEGAKALAQALGVARIKHERSKFKGNPHKVVVNWGSGNLPAEVLKCNVINIPQNVAIAANKLSFFKAVSNHARTPDWTADKLVAAQWLEAGDTVVARTVLNGHSGRGIVVVEKGEQLVNAPLYTKYVPKKQEYRIHVCNGEVVDIQRKARDKEVADENVNWKIRNHANGFIFARGEEALGEVPADVTEQSLKAVAACGLDFGAVDVVFNEKRQEAYVLEINTAPGLTGATLEGYAKRFREMFK